MSRDDDKIRFACLLRLADNALILGQQMGAMVTRGPELEEEMATANFALDYVGQARLLYSYAAEVEQAGRSEDDLAFLRDSIDYRNVLLVEQPDGDFARALARQFLFECWYLQLLTALQDSSDARLAEIAAKAVKEIRYHLRHARQWVVRLGDGTDLSKRRMQQAIDDLWRFTGELFEADEIDQWAVDQNVAPAPDSLREGWQKMVGETLAEATLTMPESGWMDSGGRKGRHTEHHGYILAEMQFLQRAYPGQTW